MAEPGAFHIEMYRDTAIPIPQRVRRIESHIGESLVQEAREGSFAIGMRDYQFTWGRGSRRQGYFLELERQRQALMLTELGSRLGLNEDECFNLLPGRFPKRPSSHYRRRGLNTPLLVPKFPGVSWQELIQAMEGSIHYYPKGRIWTSDRLNERIGELREWQDPLGFKTPDKPYSTWVKIPPTLSSFFPRPHIWLLAPEQARLRMPQDARGCNPLGWCGSSFS